MPKLSNGLTAAQEILLAAAQLVQEGRREFSEWDLTVTAWNRNQNKFGCRGYEDKYPDHKRVMSEIMGKTKKDNPRQRGWMEKTRTNYYKLTPLGLAEADRLTGLAANAQPTGKSAQLVYDAVEKYVFHKVFQSHLQNREEPRTWLGAAAFLGLTQYTPTVLERQLRSVREAVHLAIQKMSEESKDVLIRGPSGGSREIKRPDLERLSGFVDLLEQRFTVQMNAIRAKAS